MIINKQVGNEGKLFSSEVFSFAIFKQCKPKCYRNPKEDLEVHIWEADLSRSEYLAQK